ncbi:MAG TPA: hypothetical protein VGK21_17665 [Candidatus Angelobacter sp.]|jgi:hypothetical protein
MINLKHCSQTLESAAGRWDECQPFIDGKIEKHFAVQAVDGFVVRELA